MIKAALRVGSKTDAPPLTHFSDFHPHPPLLERGATATGVSACVKAPPRLPSSPLAARPPALSSPPRQTRKSDWRGDGRRARAPPREKKRGVEVLVGAFPTRLPSGGAHFLGKASGLLCFRKKMINREAGGAREGGVYSNEGVSGCAAHPFPFSIPRASRYAASFEGRASRRLGMILISCLEMGRGCGVHPKVCSLTTSDGSQPSRPSEVCVSPIRT